MPYTRRFEFPGAPDDSRPWRNWHPFVGIPMTLLGLAVVLAHDLFVLSFLTGGLALLLWWAGSCFVRRESWRVAARLATEGLALVTIVCWAVLLIREFCSGV